MNRNGIEFMRLLVALLLIPALLLGGSIAAQDDPVVIDWANDAAWHEAGQDALDEASRGVTGIGVNTVIFTSTDSYQAAVRGALPTDDAFPLFGLVVWLSHERPGGRGAACGCHRHLANAY